MLTHTVRLTAFDLFLSLSDKPVVHIVLHNTLDSTLVPNSSGSLNYPDVFVVDGVICDPVEYLPECQKNIEAITAVSQWLSTKVTNVFPDC